MLYTDFPESDRQIVERVAAIAETRGVPRAQVALAWVIQKQGITAPIVGASKSHHLTDAVAALSLGLTAEEIVVLEAPYVPHHATPQRSIGQGKYLPIKSVLSGVIVNETFGA